MKRTRISYTLYSPNYSYAPQAGECWEYGTIRVAKRKAQSLGIGSVFVRDFTQEDRAGRFVGEWWQTQFCWVWNGLEFRKAYSVVEKNGLYPTIIGSSTHR